MQSSSQNDCGLSHSSPLQASSASTRAAGEHSGSASHSWSSLQFKGRELSGGTAHTLSVDTSNRLSLLDSGWSPALQFCHASSSSGGLASSPERPGDSRTSRGRFTKTTPSDVTRTDPQLSMATVCPIETRATWTASVHRGSLVFKLTATSTVHEAPLTIVPQGHR